MKPRYYQREARVAIFEYFASGGKGNPLVALPTGTGKSLVIADFIRVALELYPRTRIMVLTHVRELVRNNLETLQRVWPLAPAGVYAAGLGRKEKHFQITFGSIQSCARTPESFAPVDLIIIDEAHLVPDRTGTQYLSFLHKQRSWNPKLKVVGLTATPYRMGQGMLTDKGGIFNDICYDKTDYKGFNEFVANGFLAPLVTKKPGMQISDEGLSVRAGEFVNAQVLERVDKDDITKAAVEEMVTFGERRKRWLVFASGVEHAEHVASCLEDYGVPAAVVHGKLPTKQRDQILADSKAGKYKAIVNYGVLTTGYDDPVIDLIAMLRLTRSPSLWVQMLGRGTRPSPETGKQDCLVLDFAGNAKRLGPINDPVLPRRRGEKGSGVAPVKLCKCCNTYNHASVTKCVQCGEEFPRDTKLAAHAGTDEVMRTDAPEVAVFKVSHVNYALHKKQGRPDSIKITYQCGLRQFFDFACLEHEGFASKKARDWWREASTEDYDVPSTTAEAMRRLGELASPYNIRVWINKRFPEVLFRDFTGELDVKNGENKEKDEKVLDAEVVPF